MRWWWPVVLVAAWLQLSWLSFIQPFGVVPNLVLATIVLAALRLPASTAVSLAITGGLILDLAGGSWFGWSMAVLVAVVLAIGFVNTKVGWELDGWWVPVMLMAAATTIMTLGIWLSVLVNGGQVGWTVVPVKLMIELAANTVVVLAGRAFLSRYWPSRGVTN
jgi:hypothetical protein